MFYILRNTFYVYRIRRLMVPRVNGFTERNGTANGMKRKQIERLEDKQNQ